MSREFKEQLKKIKPCDDLETFVLSSPLSLQLHLGTCVGITDGWDWPGKEVVWWSCFFLSLELGLTSAHDT